MIRTEKMMRPEHPSDPPLRQLAKEAGALSYTDEGTGVPLVCLHGGPGSVRDFRWIAPVLTEHFRVIRTEQPGFGGTPIAACPEPDFSARADWFVRCLDHLGINQSLLLCHSLGGGYGAAIAARHPDRVAGVAMIAALGLSKHRGMRSASLAQLVTPFLRFSRLRTIMMPIIREGFRRGGFPRSVPDDAYVETMRMVAAIDFRAHRKHLETMNAPCFIAWAQDDPLVETAISEVLSTTANAGPRHVFPRGGHNLQKTMAVELSNALKAWSATLNLNADRSLKSQ
ncbi:MAG: alpha/beta hydrolase [Myxococcota bacterium]|nr:alpha/beta hydrolase [Myxococcota bacterium]